MNEHREEVSKLQQQIMNQNSIISRKEEKYRRKCVEIQESQELNDIKLATKDQLISGLKEENRDLELMLDAERKHSARTSELEKQITQKVHEYDLLSVEYQWTQNASEQQEDKIQHLEAILAAQNVSRKNNLSHAKNQSHASFSDMIWSIIVIGAVAGTVLIMCGAFRCFYWYQKQRWEIKKINNLVKVRKKTDVVAMLTKAEEKDRSIDKFKWPEMVKKEEPFPTLGRDPESFDNLMRNSAVVQDVVMEEIHGEMETEGGINGVTEIQQQD